MNEPIATADRRANPQLRTIFIEAYDVLAPFFDPSNTLGVGGHEHFAYRALREQFPQLSIQEVSILVTAAKRVFHSGGPPADP